MRSVSCICDVYAYERSVSQQVQRSLLFGFANKAIMAAVNVEETLLVFLGTVDLPRVHPAEVLEEVEKFFNGAGLRESWHLAGLSTSAFKKE